MYGEWKFRFLAHSLTTFGHESAASGSCSFKSDIHCLISSRASEASAIYPDDTPDKTGLAVVGWRGATPSTRQTAVDFDLLAACCPNDFAKQSLVSTLSS